MKKPVRFRRTSADNGLFLFSPYLELLGFMGNGPLHFHDFPTSSKKIAGSFSVLVSTVKAKRPFRI